MEVIKKLLENGCDPNKAKDQKTGENSLHHLVYRLAGAAESDKLIKAGLRKKAPKTMRDQRKSKFRASEFNSSSNLNEHDDEAEIDKSKLNTDHGVYLDTEVLVSHDSSFDSSNEKNPKDDFKNCIKILEALISHNIDINC